MHSEAFERQEAGLPEGGVGVDEVEIVGREYHDIAGVGTRDTMLRTSPSKYGIRVLPERDVP
jgi:hypothetical protein